MRKTVIAAVAVLVGCGGAPFTAAEIGDGGGGAVQAADAVPEVDAGSQGRDAGPDAREELTDRVVPVRDGGEAGLPAEAAVDAGPGSEAEAGPVCVTDLSGVGIGDFRVSFTIATTDAPASYMALLNQRTHCDDTRPGWDVWMTAAGDLGVEVFDGAAGSYDNVTHDGRAVNDGAPHRVAVGRSGGGTVLTVSVDSVARNYPGEPAMSLGTLAPLNEGSDPTCTGVSPLSGQLTDVCVSR